VRLICSTKFESNLVDIQTQSTQIPTPQTHVSMTILPLLQRRVNSHTREGQSNVWLQVMLVVVFCGLSMADITRQVRKFSCTVNLRCVTAPASSRATTMSGRLHTAVTWRLEYGATLLGGFRHESFLTYTKPRSRGIVNPLIHTL